MTDLKAKLQYTGKLRGFLLEYNIYKNITTIGRENDSDITLSPQGNVWFPVNLGGNPDRLAKNQMNSILKMLAVLSGHL